MCMSAIFSPEPPAPPPVAVPAVEPPKQAEKAPDVAAARDQNRAKMSAGGTEAGVSSTFLTGVGGVDPTQLALGKQTLLGQ